MKRIMRCVGGTVVEGLHGVLWREAWKEGRGDAVPRLEKLSQRVCLGRGDEANTRHLALDVK